MCEPLRADRRPCSSCPYAVDTPTGVWHPDEYEKLLAYAEGSDTPALGLFLCHHSALGKPDTLCRGWLTVEAESIAVRLGMAQGRIDPDEVRAPVAVDLYPSGTAAALAGLAGVNDPTPDARRLIDTITTKQARR